MRDKVAAAFESRCGRPPDGVWAAPGRVNLIGEHTDYNDGWVLPFAIEAEIVVAAAPRTDEVLRMWSLQEAGGPVEVRLERLEPGGVDGWAAFVAGCAWALRDGGVTGADLVVSSTVPLGAGLSSSAALTCATTAALCELAGRELEPIDLAMTARSAEADFVGAPIGVMDQLASVLGRAGHALLIDTRRMQVQALPFDPPERGFVLLILDTRVQHSVGSGAYGERRAACEAAAERLGVPSLREAGLHDLTRLDGMLLRRARHVVTENERVLATAERLREQDLPGVGPLMSASHVSLRDDYEVSAPELDAVVDAALAAGAEGARMTGSGFGGSAIALMKVEDEEAVRASVLAALPDCEIIAAVAADGARRVA